MISREAFVILLQRIWQAFAGVVTVVLVAKYLTPYQQGWYYAFTSLAALFALFELGLSSAILQSSAIYFQEIKFNLNNPFEKFQSYIRRAFYEYLKVVILYFSVMIVFGLFYFHAKESQGELIQWTIPWVVLIIVTSCSLMLYPFLSILEGMGLINEAYAVRLFQGVGGSIASWVTIAGGGFLWATVVSPTLAVIVAILWLIWSKKNFISHLFKYSNNNAFNWDRDVKPLQRKIGITWVGAFLMSQLATPILFYTTNPVIAGQMGLSLTFAHMIGHLAQVPIAKSVPNMAKAVNSKSWGEFNFLINRGLLELLGIFMLITSFSAGAYELLLPAEYFNRILPKEELLKLAVFVLLYQLCATLATHLRAFNQEPLAPVYALGATVTLAGSIFVASEKGSSGVVDIMLFTQLLFVFPVSLLVWRYCINNWRQTKFQCY